jgi:hypothetical protein
MSIEHWEKIFEEMAQINCNNCELLSECKKGCEIPDHTPCDLLGRLLHGKDYLSRMDEVRAVTEQ